MYTRLELLESKFRNLLHKKDADTSRLNEVGAMYTSIKSRMEEFKAGKADEAPHSGVVPPDQFTPLFKAILDSEISFDDLLYAAFEKDTRPTLRDSRRTVGTQAKAVAGLGSGKVVTL